MSWWAIAIAVVISVLAIVMAPKPPNKPKPELKDLGAPTAAEGHEVPVIYGVKRVDQPNIVGYNDMETLPVRSKSGK